MTHPLGKHLDNQQIVAHLYGMEDAASRAHLGVCADCLERYEAAERRRALLTGFKPPTPAQLAQQRAAITATIERRPAMIPRWVWAPAAAGLLLAAGLYWWQPPPAPVAEPEPSVSADSAVETMDADWYKEIYNDIDLMEPRAAGPIRELFVEETASE